MVRSTSRDPAKRKRGTSVIFFIMVFSPDCVYFSRKKTANSLEDILPESGIDLRVNDWKKS
jgi:hypothetical protein